MDFRFNAHDATTGEYLYALPRPAQAQIGDVFGDRGTLELTYSAKQARAVDLPTFVEVRVQVQYDGGEWADVGPALVRLGGSHEDTDQAGMRTVRFVGREWLLSRARVSAGDAGKELIDGKRPFYQASAGQIMRTLILEAKDRGAAAGIDLGPFTNTTDSAGNTWSEQVTIYYSPGLPIGDVLQNLVDQGLCDYRMNGRTLELYEPETTLGRDLTDRNFPVRVHGAVTEAPVTYTLEDLANSALLIGEDGFELEVNNPSAPTDYGRLEVTIEQGGVNQEGTARTMIDAELQRGSREIREITRTQHAAGAHSLPYRDYRCGDFVQAYDQGEWVRYRVREIQLVRDAEGWTVHTVLNDRLQELLLRLAKKTNGIVNGSRGSGGGGTRPAPPPRPGVEPAAPQGLVIDQQVYLDDAGTARGVVEAGWGEVTESTRGLAIDIGGYELWWRQNTTFATWQRATATSGDTSVAHSPVVLTDGNGDAMEYQWRVRAVAQESARPGPFSSIVTLTMTQDTTPPPPPSMPIVETGFRIVTVEWDGVDEDGMPMPRDFAWTRIYLAAAEDMAGARRVGSLGHPGSWNSDTLPADVPVWVALTAVDRVGNESAMTPAVSVTPRQLVDDEAIRGELGRIENDYQDAIADLQQDIENIVIDEQGAVTYWMPTQPDETTTPAPKQGDLWFNTSDGSKLHRHDGQGWVSAADERIQQIQDAYDDFESELNTVRQTADGKNRTYYQSTQPTSPAPRAGDLWFNTANGFRLHRHNGTGWVAVDDARIAALQDDVENIDISGPLSEARDEWLQDAAADAQQKAQNAANTAEAAAKAYADAVATGAVEGELEGLQDYADNAAEQARQAAIAAAIAEARVLANEARDEALTAALDADLVLSQSIAEFENDLDLVRQSADGKNSITWSPSTASGPGESGDTWFRTSGNMIIGYWRHNGSSWVAMSMDPVVIPNLDAGKITSGFIDAARIRAGSIQAEKLMVGNFTNLIPDPAALHGITDTWRRWGSESIGTAGAFWRYGTTTGGQSGVRAGHADFFGSSRWLTSTPFQVRPGDRYFIQVTSYNTELVGGSPRFGLRLGDESNGFMGETPVTVMSNSGWETYTAIVEIPDNSDIKQAALRYTIPSTVTGGYAYFSDPVVRPAVGGVMIEDGAVVAEKISAGAVGATAIAAESIDASKIVAGGIQADHILVPGTVGGTLIRDGAVTTNHIEAGSITASSGIIASLDAGVISTGYLDAARLRAGSISAEKLMIGNATNLIADPGALGNIEDSWLAYGSGQTGTGQSFWRYGTTTAGHRGVRAGNSTDFGVNQWLGSEKFQVRPGDKIYWQVRVYQNDLVGASPSVNIRLGDEDDAFLGQAGVLTATGGGWTVYSQIVEIPNNPDVAWARLRYTIPASATSGYAYFVDPVVRPAVGSTLIESGAITTDKIAVGAITAESGVVGSLNAGTITVGHMSGERISAGTIDATRVIIGDTISGTLIQEGAISTDKITANAVTAGKIAALAITADKIAANAIQADKIAAGAIDGKMITGATIRTSASGARVQMTSQGFYAYDSSNSQTFSINANTGAVSLTGNVYQRNSYGQAVFGPTLYSGQTDIGPAIGFPVTGTTYSGSAGIYAREASTDGKPELHLQGPHTSTNQGTILDLAAGDSTEASIFQRSWPSGNNSYLSLGNTGDAVVQARGSAFLRSNGTSGGAKSWFRANADRSIYMSSDTGSSVQIESNGYATLQASSSAGYGRAYVRAQPNGEATLGGQAGDSYFRVNSNGVLQGYGLWRNQMSDPVQTVVMDNGGRMGRYASSRRWKTQIEPVPAESYEDGLLSLDFSSWVSKGTVERSRELAEWREQNPMCPVPESMADAFETPPRQVGMIAEEVHDAGVHDLVVYDAYGQPESIVRENFGMMLIPIIKRLRDRVDALEHMIGETP